MENLLEEQFECAKPKEEFDFQLLKMENVFSFDSKPDRNPFESHRVHFFTILLLTEGEMIHEVDFIKYE
ncbi:MAG: hypothetical protein AAF551_11825, partial [Bacteroidota bacterium]